MALQIDPEHMGTALLEVLLRQIRLEANLRQITMTQSEILAKLAGRRADDILREMEVDGQADTDVAVIGTLRGMGIAEDCIHGLLVQIDQTRRLTPALRMTPVS